MDARDVSNPLNRFREIAVAYDEGEGPPPTKVKLLEDHSRSILSRNDSPDIGFRWSANPYRGCLHACSYCLSGDTPILMGDGRTKRLAELKVDDEIYGTQLRGRYRYYARTRVQAHWKTVKLAYRITLANGTELTASGDHRFLTERGWKYVMPLEDGQRPHLTVNNAMIGVGQFAPAPAEDEDYKRGYLCGMIRGDATLERHDYLAVADLEALARSKRFLASLDVETRELELAVAEGFRPVRAIRANGKERDARRAAPPEGGAKVNAQSSFAKVTELRAWPDAPTASWDKGFLAGIFDAEGSRSEHVVRIANMDPEIIGRTRAALARFGFDAVTETITREPRPLFNVRIRGGLAAHLRFFHLTGPAITRKWEMEGHAVKHAEDLRVVAIDPLGVRELFDITTGTEDFIANGVVSHNCYARPTHEYLDMGAGTDFDTKIVVKRNAPELLRETFDKPSWEGDLIMFSGVTDCYQAIEKDLEITKQCLEVCLEYRNPVSIISKAPLIERDIELFLALQRDAHCHIAVSLAFSDNELSRTIEPWVASPDRRFKTIERLAKAGLEVSVMLAPIIPGVNDKQMVTVLERAAAAGATSAGWVLLRLPGAVKQVFEERIREAMPLAADKILNRIRDTRGGEKLYDASFHTRGRGEGAYADTIAMIFDSTTRRLGLDRRHESKYDDHLTFRRPPTKTAQLSLF